MYGGVESLYDVYGGVESMYDVRGWGRESV